MEEKKIEKKLFFFPQYPSIWRCIIIIGLEFFLKLKNHFIQSLVTFNLLVTTVLVSFISAVTVCPVKNYNFVW